MKKLKKTYFIIALALCILSIFFSVHAEVVSNKKVIIDVGHGGRDGGATANETSEAELNLEISLELKKVFENNGYEVDLTREENKDLCDNEFIKREDMNKRIKKIHSGNYLFCISIHQNTYPDSKYRGAQVFYNDINPKNKVMAANVQNSIKYFLNNTTRDIVKRNNVYLLNKVSIPIVIVECGFLTNKEEVLLLKSKDYQKQLAYSIYYGSIKTTSVN